MDIYRGRGGGYTREGRGRGGYIGEGRGGGYTGEGRERGGYTGESRGYVSHRGRGNIEEGIGYTGEGRGYVSHRGRVNTGEGRGYVSHRGRGNTGSLEHEGRGRGYTGEGRGYVSNRGGPMIPSNRKITLKTNMYRVEIKGNLEEIIYRYEVEFYNEKGENMTRINKILRRTIITELSKYMEKITPFAYDGMTALFTLKPMRKIPELELKKDWLKKDGLYYMIETSDRRNKIVIELRPTQLTWNEKTEIQMLQIAIQYSSYRQSNNQLIKGNNIYDTEKAEKFMSRYLISDLMLFKGIFQSFRNTKIGLVINVDVSYFVALGAYNLIEWLELTAKREGYRSLGEGFSDAYFREMLNKELKGMEIKTTYGYRRKYKLEGIDFNNTPKTAKFKTGEKNDKAITIKEYMKDKYNISINNDYLPLLLVKCKMNEGPTWIVPEFCYFTEGQRRRSILTAEERAFMIDKTRSFPRERFGNIETLTKDITDNDYFKSFPIRIDNSKSVVTEARVLDTLNLDFFKNFSEPDNKGSWNFINKQFKYVSNQESDWAIVFPPKFIDRLDDFLNGFFKVANNLGIHLYNKPYEKNTKGNSIEDYIDTLKFFSTLENLPDFVLIVLPDQNSKRYKAIKNFCDLDLKIPSKCLVADDKNRFLQPAFQSNLLASLNVKLGNYNWSIPLETVKTWLSNNNSLLCVMGLDVCHGITSSNYDNSTVALCASINSDFTNYYTSIAYQSARREIVVDIQLMFYECLKAFFDKNGFLPSDILFYRDGVGEGMYDIVRDYEINHIYAACDDAYGDLKLPNPRITYVLVQKRHHLRSTWVVDNDSHNPPYGAFINSTITDSLTKNFYLYSHHALQGTARPTHYHIFLDHCGFGDNIIPFTFALAHLHQGCPKSVSIPVPVFYADVAAARVFDYYYGAKEVPSQIQNGFTV